MITMSGIRFHSYGLVPLLLFCSYLVKGTSCDVFSGNGIFIASFHADVYVIFLLEFYFFLVVIFLWCVLVLGNSSGMCLDVSLFPRVTQFVQVEQQ